MHIGITIFATDLAMDPVELAREAEARGFHSLYIPEHTHIPTSRRTPPPTGDAVLAEEYKRTLDPYVALAAAAARDASGSGSAPASRSSRSTTRSRSPRSSPRSTWLSRGRLVLGIGYGWNHEEMENHGIDAKRRRERVREKMLAMQALWTPGGRGVPRRVRALRAELAVAEADPAAAPAACCSAARRARSCSSTSPSTATAGCRSAGRGSQGLAQLRRAVEARPRPAALHIVPMGVLPTPEKLDHYRELGVHEAVLRVPSAPRDEVMPVLDASRGTFPARGGRIMRPLTRSFAILACLVVAFAALPAAAQSVEPQKGQSTEQMQKDISECRRPRRSSRAATTRQRRRRSRRPTRRRAGAFAARPRVPPRAPWWRGLAVASTTPTTSCPTMPSRSTARSRRRTRRQWAPPWAPRSSGRIAAKAAARRRTRPRRRTRTTSPIRAAWSSRGYEARPSGRAGGAAPIEISSTSKIKVEFGGIREPAPRVP